MTQPPAAWAHLPFFARDWPALSDRIAADPRPILPPAPLRFAALDALPPERVKAVILGQDPYPTPGHAMGHAFSVARDVRPIPRSLQNIYKELESDLGIPPAPHGDLSHWASQGVLLLNTALTVPQGDAGGHRGIGWEHLAAEVLTALSDAPRAFILWGKPAQSYARFIRGTDHLILTAPHPSPLSARRGFFGSRPFSGVNRWLKARGQPEIDWTPR